MISKRLEEYIEAMYILKKQKETIRVTDVAIKMNCTKPSVNKALMNLKKEGLIEYESYGEIELSKKAESIAKKNIEAYDIVYVFLKYVIELEEKDAKMEAENMKMAIKDTTINKLAKYVHKVLDLNNLDCNYDVNEERCRNCLRRTLNKLS